MLTGKGEVQDRISGIEAGADDYMIKPFDPDELLVRIKSILKRTVTSLDANPSPICRVTLPLWKSSRTASTQKIFAIGYADLDKFKAYNDLYGFEKGDEVIKEMARILIKVVRDQGGANTFIGHIGGDDMVFIVDDAGGRYGLRTDHQGIRRESPFLLFAGGPQTRIYHQQGPPGQGAKIRTL